jgi:HK97 gp10 family phage protein
LTPGQGNIEVKGIEELLKNFDQYSAETQKKVTDSITLTAINIRTDAMRSMKASPASGRTYKRRSVSHTASVGGNAPRIDTGRLLNSIRWVASATEAVVGVFGAMDLKGNVTAKSEGLGDGTRSTYAAALEFGTKNMESRPFLFPAFEKERQNFFRRITEAMRSGK